MIRGRFTLAAAIAFGLVGCGGAPEAGDPTPARSILETALESWKRGDAPKALRDASPPVVVVDYRWEAGYKLTGYTIAESSTPAGFDRRFSVDLRLTTPKGKASKEKAGYLVATSPALTVARDPES